MNCRGKKWKSDIRKLWRYFKIEMESRQHDFPFSIDVFDNMITGMFFWSPNSKDAIQKLIITIPFIPYSEPNIKDTTVLTNRFSLKFICISLNSHTMITNKGVREDFLISNACKSPFLFDSMFKHLALDVYKVPRLDLGSKLDRYEDFHYLGDFIGYQFFMQAVRLLWPRTFCHDFTILVAIDELILSLYGYNPVISGGLIVITLTLLHVIVYYHYKYKFDRFDEYDPAALKRFSKLLSVLPSVDFDIWIGSQSVSPIFAKQKYAWAWRWLNKIELDIT